MRKLVIAAATIAMAGAFATAAAPRSHAAEGAWCSWINGDDYRDCTKRTLQQCEGDYGFGGSSCAPNPNFPGPVTRRGRQ